MARGNGAEELLELGKALKAAGDKQLRKESLAAIKDASRPLVEAAQDGARDTLPSGGGLGEYVAKSRFTPSVRLSGNSAGVSIKAAKSKKGGKVDLDALDRGRLRHPLWGNRRHWFTQSVPSGWFTDALTKKADDVRDKVADAIHAALKRAVK